MIAHRQPLRKARLSVGPRAATGVIASLVMWAVGVSAAAAQPRVYSEYDIKAGMIYNLTKFITWPDDAFEDEASPLTLCVLGEDPFGASLWPLERKTTRGRRLAVKRSSYLEELRPCQVLFISTSEEDRLSEVLQALEGASVLTVGDMNFFAHRGGMIRFVKRKNRLGLELNGQAAEDSKLHVSFKLKKLASAVSSGGS